MMASRVTLDSQGRLVHRENGKLILPFEHFANAVMLKHMNRPHTMHLNLEATVRSVSTIIFLIIFPLILLFLLFLRLFCLYKYLGYGILYNWTRLFWHGEGIHL